MSLLWILGAAPPPQSKRTTKNLIHVKWQGMRVVDNSQHSYVRQFAAGRCCGQSGGNGQGWTVDANKLQTGLPVPLEELVEHHIERVLAVHDGNVSAAARALHMHRRTLQRKLAKARRNRIEGETAK